MCDPAVSETRDGVLPCSTPSTNTGTPDGFDCTLSDPVVGAALLLAPMNFIETTPATARITRAAMMAAILPIERFSGVSDCVAAAVNGASAWNIALVAPPTGCAMGNGSGPNSSVRSRGAGFGSSGATYDGAGGSGGTYADFGGSGPTYADFGRSGAT